jgi:hypothetical protein
MGTPAYAVTGKIPPAPPVTKWEREARGDLSPQIRCTNLEWRDLDAAE